MTVPDGPPPDAWCSQCGHGRNLVEHLTGISLGAPDLAPGVPDPDGITEHVEWICSVHPDPERPTP